MTTTPPLLQVQLFGAFRVLVAGRVIPEGAWRGRRSASLVKLLALAEGHRLHREQAMDFLWPDSATRAVNCSAVASWAKDLENWTLCMRLLGKRRCEGDILSMNHFSRLYDLPRNHPFATLRWRLWCGSSPAPGPRP